MMDTYDRVSGTRSPLAFLGYLMPKLFVFKVEGEGEAGAGEEKPAGEAAPEGKFFDGFSPEVKGHPTVTRYNSAEDLAKGHIELEKKISAKGVIVPTEGSGEDDIKAFHKAIGVPADANGYVPVKLEGLHELAVSDDASTQLFKETALKLGLNPAQYNGIREMYLKDVSTKLTAMDEQKLQARNDAETNLRSELGGQYESKLLMANKIIKEYGGQEALDALAAKGGNDPSIVKMMMKISDHLSEDALGKMGASSLGMTKGEATAKINEMRNDPSSAYNDQNNSGHDEAVSYMQSLYKIRDGLQ
jgi:hypothetical protein